MIDRRRFLQIVSAGVLAAPLAAGAQQADRVYRIGLIGVDAGERAGQAALRQGLRALGYEEGRNLIIEYREANGPFATIDDIIDVAGIGTGTFERIKDLITVGE